MNTKQIRLGQCLIHILISIIILYGAEIAGMIISAGFAELFPSSSFKVISGTLSYITIAILCFTWYTGKFFPVVPDSLGLKRKVPACILVIVISLPLMYSLITFLILRGQGYWETSFRNNNQFISQLLTILIDIGIAAGIVEELIFRGMIMRSIESYSGKKAAVVITSVLFTILHIPGWDGGYAAFVSGCLSTMALSVLLSLLVYDGRSVLSTGITCARSHL